MQLFARGQQLRRTVEAAITAGSFPSMPGIPIGQTSFERSALDSPAARIWLKKRARLVAEPMSPTKPKRSTEAPR